MNNQNFEILKSDSDRKLVFGWASVAITVNGEQLEDRQQDIIDPDDLEEAAYEYVLNFRDTGEEHIPTMRKKGKLVESCVLTAEKQKAMGIPEGAVPVGWWIGFKIEDDAAWERVKSGQYRMFSIEGKANRIPVEKSRSSYDEYKPVAKTFADVLKFNPNHDRLGRFASAGNGGGQTVLFNTTHYRKMLEHPDIKAIMANRDFEYYGIRVQEEDTETVGKVMTHHSVNEGGDFEDNEWMSDEDKERLEDLAGELDGVSTIGIYDIEQVGKYGGYPGKVAYLLGSDETPETGYDPGEAVMKEPTVLAKMEYKDGKIVVKDKVQIQPEAESKPKPESATQTNARQENPGYTKFMAEMKAKYGDDMWSNMTDSEMDAADRWESHRYDPVGKSAVAKTFEDVLKFNPYHDSKGRFASANSATSFTWRPGASKMHDKAIAGEKDRTHRSDFHDKIKGLILTSYTYNPQEMPQMLIGIGKEVAKEIDSRFKAKKKAGETTEDEPQTEDIYDVLRDVRSFGPGEYANKVFNSSDLDDKRTKAIMDDALGRYPTDWYADAIFDCGVDIRDTDGRAFHYVGYDSTSQIKVYAKESPELVKQLDLKSDSITNLGIANQLAHEMGHYFERSNTDVGNAARAYYDKRTKSSELTEMYPGEYTKKDHFADEYMGKYYTSGSTEITSVLVQKLGYLDPKKSITQDLFSNQKKDIQSYNFVLGLLAGGGTKWEE